MCSGERGHIIPYRTRRAAAARGREHTTERVACKSSGARYREQRAAADRAGGRLKRQDVGRARDYKMAPRSCYVSIEIISTARSLNRPPAPARSTLTYTRLSVLRRKARLERVDDLTHIPKAIVQRRRRRTNHIRLAAVDDDALLVERLLERLHRKRRPRVLGDRRHL